MNFKNLNIFLVMLLVCLIVVLVYKNKMYHVNEDFNRLNNLNKVLVHLKEGDDYLNKQIVKEVSVQCVPVELMEDGTKEEL